MDNQPPLCANHESSLAALVSLRSRTGLLGIVHPVSSRGNFIRIPLGWSLNLCSDLPVNFQRITFLFQRHMDLLNSIISKYKGMSSKKKHRFLQHSLGHRCQPTVVTLPVGHPFLGDNFNKTVGHLSRSISVVMLERSEAFPPGEGREARKV